MTEFDRKDYNKVTNLLILGQTTETLNYQLRPPQGKMQPSLSLSSANLEAGLYKEMFRTGHTGWESMARQTNIERFTGRYKELLSKKHPKNSKKNIKRPLIRKAKMWVI